MKAKLLAVFCALTLLLGAVPAAGALEGEAQRAADTLVTLGLIDETGDLTAPATRAQAAVLLVDLAAAAEDAAMTTGSPASGTCLPRHIPPSPMPLIRAGSPA